MTATFPTSLDEVLTKINPEAIKAEGFSKPKSVHLMKGMDGEGEEALFVYVVYPDNTPDQQLAWAKIEPLVSWVRDIVWQTTGLSQWPYVWVKRESEISAKIR